MATVFQGGIWKMTIAWAITGCGHYLTQVMAILAELPGADVFLSRAAEEVLTIYNHDIDTLVRSGKKVYRERAYSSPMVGRLYHQQYRLLVIAPATSNSVAKFVLGISDSLVANLFAQAGKCRVPIVVLPSDTDEAVTSPGPRGPVQVFPRPIDLANTDQLVDFPGVTVVKEIKELEQCLRAYL